MSIFYSATSNGFYSSGLKDDYVAAGTWPGDTIEISDRWYNHLFEGQSNGKVITANEYGQPVLSNPPPPSKNDMTAAAEVQKKQLLSEAMTAIAPLQDAVEFSIATENEISKLQAWKVYRVALNRIDTSSAPDISWPSRPE
ncbi:tail fiber assembly protein [Enterobacter kobei]|uniref:tail fiber assembly protein n=1 Tax=Enterobacter kobei TaxID=208224 RepID=UPI002A80FFBA|nr:tail fiber assembly protein [Enterobacter kobei]